MKFVWLVVAAAVKSVTPPLGKFIKPNWLLIDYYCNYTYNLIGVDSLLFISDLIHICYNHRAREIIRIRLSLFVWLVNLSAGLTPKVMDGFL